MGMSYDEIASYIIQELKDYSTYYDENTFNEFKSIFESIYSFKNSTKKLSDFFEINLKIN